VGFNLVQWLRRVAEGQGNVIRAFSTFFLVKVAIEGNSGC